MSIVMAHSYASKAIAATETEREQLSVWLYCSDEDNHLQRAAESVSERHGGARVTRDLLIPNSIHPELQVLVPYQPGLRSSCNASSCCCI